MLQIHFITIFPEMFKNVLGLSILKRAKEKQLTEYHLHNLRDWSSDERQTVDDRPFGGGAGMVMLLEPVYKAVRDIKKQLTGKNVKVILTSASGERFIQQKAAEYKQLDALIIICGHYEGVDARVAEHLADEEISIGDYVLTGGELPAMVIADAVVRLLPGVLGNEKSLTMESHNEPGVVEAPQYTRPAEFVTDEGEKWSVPEVLLSGNHKLIAEWRSKLGKQQN